MQRVWHLVGLAGAVMVSSGFAQGNGVGDVMVHASAVHEDPLCRAAVRFQHAQRLLLARMRANFPQRLVAAGRGK